MTNVFLYGSLAAERVQALFLEPGTTEAAVLDGYSPESVKNIPFPVGYRSSGALDGVLCRDVEPARVERLRFVLEASGALAAERELRTNDGGRVLALTALAPETAVADGPDMAPDAWVTLTEAALAEILSYHGQRKAEDVARLRMMILARASARVAAAEGAAAQYRSTTRHETVTVEQVEASHRGFFLTRTYQLRHPRFDGSLTPPLTREVFVATDASIVLPYDPKRDRVLLVEQFRMGPFGRGDVFPWMLEPVAGRVDAGETPESTAHRECLEEAGLTLHGLEKVSSHYCSPGDSTEYFHVFIGLCDLPEVKQGRGGLATEHEDIRTHVLSYHEAMGLLESGEADVGPLVLALLWLANSRERLRSTA